MLLPSVELSSSESNLPEVFRMNQEDGLTMSLATLLFLLGSEQPATEWSSCICTELELRLLLG